MAVLSQCQLTAPFTSGFMKTLILVSMKFSRQVRILCVTLCVVCTLVTFREFHEHAPTRLNRQNITASVITMSTRINRAMEIYSRHNLTLNISSEKSTPRSRVKLNEPCLWKVMVWEFPYPPNLQQGHYYCPETNCTVQYIYGESYDDMKSSDVVVLHGLGSWDKTEMNSHRRPDHLLTLMTWESPPNLDYYDGDMTMFNWTMTYSYQSDIPIPFGRSMRNSSVKNQQPKHVTQKKNWAHGKTGLAAWIAFNCNNTMWPRTDFIYNLSKFMNIDKYGRCGTLPCEDEREEEHCLSKISSYKFYIAFENSLCEDYITEKMWRNAFEHGAVPIVYGAPKEDYERLAPRNSFIHISDFDDMSALASYIRLLDRNDSLYSSYFDWRSDSYTTFKTFEDAFDKTTLCYISRKLVDMTTSGRKAVVTFGNTEWAAKSCFDVSRPTVA